MSYSPLPLRGLRIVFSREEIVLPAHFQSPTLSRVVDLRNSAPLIVVFEGSGHVDAELFLSEFSQENFPALNFSHLPHPITSQDIKTATRAKTVILKVMHSPSLVLRINDFCEEVNFWLSRMVEIFVALGLERGRKAESGMLLR